MVADSPWLTVAEGASYARTCPKTVYRACEQGQLRHARVGGRRSIRLLREWVDAWLVATATPVEGPQKDGRS
jgi:excisionase family DNA binding protein